MKKICLIIIVLLFSCINSVAYAANEVSADILSSEEAIVSEIEEIILEHIDDSIKLDIKPTAKYKKITYPTLKEYKANIFENTKYTSSFLTPSSYWYMEEKFTEERAKSIKSGKIGVKYDNKISQENFQRMQTLYYEYQKNKFLLNAAYKKNSFDFFKKSDSASFSLAPEYKLTDNLSLKYVYSSKVDRQNTDLIFSIKPFKQDNINFDFGASRVYYNDNSIPKQQLIFSTEFEF